VKNKGELKMLKRDDIQPNSILVKARENARIRELNIKLLEACKLEDVVRVRSLLDKGANLHLLNNVALHAYNDNERNPVHNAAKIGNLEILDLLITFGADCNARDRRQETPLHLAVYNGYTEIINYLVSEKSADIEAQDIDGGAPLSWAAYENKREIAKQLLNLGANIDAYDYEHRSSLHWAAYRGHKEMVEFLLLNQANINAKTIDGETALDMAVNNGRTEVVELLYQVKK